MKSEIPITINPDRKKILQVLSTQVEMEREELRNYRPILSTKMSSEEIIQLSINVPKVAEYIEKIKGLTYHHEKERKAFLRQFIGHWHEMVVLELMYSGWYERDPKTKMKFTPLSSRSIKPVVKELYSPYAKVIEHDQYLGIESTSIAVRGNPVSNPDFGFVIKNGHTYSISHLGETSIQRKLGYWSKKYARLRNLIIEFRECSTTAKIFDSTRQIYVLVENVYQNSRGGLDFFPSVNQKHIASPLVSATPYTLEQCDEFFDSLLPFGNKPHNQSKIRRPVSA